MKYIKQRLNVINELHIHNKQDDYNDNFFVLYKSDVWFFTENEFDDDNLKNELTKAFSNKIDFSHVSNKHELFGILEEFPLVLFGTIKDDKIIISYRDFAHSFNSSDVKKLYKIVKLPIYTSDVNSDDIQIYVDVDKKYDKNTIYYHGTCLKFLSDILKNGITPNNESNFKVQHYDKIFFTTDLHKANFHALTTSIKNESFPIIIAFKVPDVSKLIPDYDLALEIYGKDSEVVKKYGYDKHISFSQSYDEPNLTYDRNIINKIGVFGYTGRIPSSFIFDIFIDLYEYTENMSYFHPEFGEFPPPHVFYGIDFSSPQDWSEISPKEILKIIQDRENEYISELDDEWDEDDDLEDE